MVMCIAVLLSSSPLPFGMARRCLKRPAGAERAVGAADSNQVHVAMSVRKVRVSRVFQRLRPIPIRISVRIATYVAHRKWHNSRTLQAACVIVAFAGMTFDQIFRSWLHDASLASEAALMLANTIAGQILNRLAPLYGCVWNAILHILRRFVLIVG
jgi:hypothetical protein